MNLSWWRWRMSPFKALLLSLFGIAFIVSVVRMFTGLGAVTNLSDTTPWGLWKAIDVIIYVPLGASGFTMAFTRYIVPGGHRYEEIMRRSVIWAAICYLSVGVRLAFDIGLPWRLPNPLVFGGNLHSALFEVAWCMFLYICVLFLENIPRVMERYSIPWVAKLEHFLHKIMPAFVLFGVLLSSMHQSSLGTLYMIAGRRMDALWYHPWLNYVYLLTAIGCGLSITIMIEGWSNNYYKTEFRTDLLSKLAVVVATVYAIALAWRVGVLALDGNLGLLFAARTETIFWWGEILVGFVAPIVIFATPRLRHSRPWLCAGAILAVGGAIVFRLNVVFTAMAKAMNSHYFPSIAELLFTIGATAGTMVIYTWFVETLPAILGRDLAEFGETHAD